MKAKTRQSKKSTWAIPNGPIDIQEFKNGIKQAEKGPFITLSKLKKEVDHWKKSQSQ